MKLILPSHTNALHSTWHEWVISRKERSTRIITYITWFTLRWRHT